jgi:hypothetical protein
MTIEIRELVIQAKVTASEDDMPTSPLSPGNGPECREEERLIQTITRRVLEQLREEGWGPR